MPHAHAFLGVIHALILIILSWSSASGSIAGIRSERLRRVVNISTPEELRDRPPSSTRRRRGQHGPRELLVEQVTIARLIAESFHLLLVLAVVSAPLPMIVSLIADEPERPPRSLSLADRALALLVLWVIIESLVVTSLGLASRLFLSDLLIAEALVFAAGAGMMRRRGAAVRCLFETVRARLGAITRCSFTERWLLSLVGGIATLLFLQEFGLPTDDYDSLAYQLPRVVEWYQQGTFLTQSAQWGRWINSYPYGWNTMFFLMVAPVGHDQLALLPNLAAWVMLGLAAYGLARLGGGHRSGSLAAAVMVMLMPLSLINVHSAHNDLPLGALFVSSVYWSIRAWRVPSTSAALLAVACSGMTLGAKTSGVGYVRTPDRPLGLARDDVVRERGFDSVGVPRLAAAGPRRAQCRERRWSWAPRGMCET